MLLQSLHSFEKRPRLRFGKIPKEVPVPDLLEIQKKSYEDFLQLECSSDKRKNQGLERLFRSVFPLTNHDRRVTVEYLGYVLDAPRYDVGESIQRDTSYAAPLKLKIRLLVWEGDDVKSIKEQDVNMGAIPLMTTNGSFVINGVQRVIVSQLHKSPGVFYFKEYTKGTSSEKVTYFARVIPNRGSWLDFELDPKDLMYFQIDKKRKLYVTTLLKAMGYDNNQILSTFYKSYSCRRKNDHWVARLDLDFFNGIKVQKDVIDSDTGKILIQSGTRITQRTVDQYKSKNPTEDKFYVLSDSDIISRFVAVDIYHDQQLILPAGGEVTLDVLEKIIDKGITELQFLHIDYINVGPYIRNTLMLDTNESKEKALLDICRSVRPGDMPTLEIAEKVFHSSFFDPLRYSLSPTGRMKVNLKHSLNIPEEVTQLRKEDIIIFINHLIRIRDTNGPVDDVDSLGNRRVRSVGELLEIHLRSTFVPRGTQTMMNRLNAISDHNAIKIHDIVNSKNLISAVNEFFSLSQLSQFMNQTNPISELTHKRRVSALGPGGLTRDRAESSVREVHYTHYGRICPIETPEGHNIGLMGSLATYARINGYGFIETPCRKVVDRKVTDEVVYISPMEEVNCIIAQADVKISPDNLLVDDFVNSRKAGEFTISNSKDVTHMDISPKQTVSIAASLIPFLGHTDAARALMGTNMQRQALPLLQARRAVVGTGMESHIARGSETVVIAKESGTVVWVDASKIVIRVTQEDRDSKLESYYLEKYQRSNRSTCINQRPIVNVGDKVIKGSVIADGSCTDLGELALGRDVLAAFMLWDGYNFEDGIIVSEQLIRDGVFTSLHIMKYQCMVSDTRLGDEKTTSDIPNVSSDLSTLDENGIIHIGQLVKEGDILVGKTTPIVEAPLTPEEKLLKAIFGETGTNVKDSSLRVPIGVSGVVIDVNIFTRRGVEKDDRTLAMEGMQIQRVMSDVNDQLLVVQGFVKDECVSILLGQALKSAGLSGLKAGTKLTKDLLDDMSIDLLLDIVVKDANVSNSVSKLKAYYIKIKAELEEIVRKKTEKIQSCDDLPHGVLKIVNVYVATKLPLQSGDKMAGRHGNKGIVSITAPIADMPFLPNGRPIDVILNPLGVISRMNIGQILETHLGLASSSLGEQIQSALNEFKAERTKGKMKVLREKLFEIYSIKEDDSHNEVLSLLRDMNDEEVEKYVETLKHGIPVTTPVFDDATEEDVDNMLKKANLPVSGQLSLIDGRTGEYFDRDITVGYLHILKLHHLVDEKIHARSIGTYSLITQQPLGGKAQFGAQRFGEMEVWALEAYGASYMALEMMTVKSDDTVGRAKMYENILNGNLHLRTGIPESFKVVEKEMKSLGLNVELVSF